MESRQCMLPVKLGDIERVKFDGSLAKHKICQYFPNCAIWILCTIYILSKITDQIFYAMAIDRFKGGKKGCI